jgi:hypothetical protein
VLVGRKNWFLINAIPATSTAISLTLLIVTIQRAN